jgi:hypothetical protein
MAQKPETVFRGRVRKDLTRLQRLYGIFFESIAQKAIHGTPDILLCICGRFIGLELKAENGKASRLQEIKLQAIAKSGGLGIVAYPSTWKDVYELLEDLAKKDVYELLEDLAKEGMKNGNRNDVPASNGTGVPPSGSGDLE